MNVFLKIISGLRVFETLLMTGFILIGAIFAYFNNSHIDVCEIVLFGIVSFLLMLSVYCGNSFLGYNDDKSNPRLSNMFVFTKKNFLVMSISFYFISLLLCMKINPNVIVLHFLVYAIWFLYALPGFGKHLPIIGTILHFIVNVVQFNFAYLAFEPYSSSALLISVFFGFLISGGHLNHELIDYEVDKSNNILSSAVKWGGDRIAIFSFLIFVIAHIYWICLFLFDVINFSVFIPFLFSFLVHIILFFSFFNKMKTLQKYSIKYRTYYRLNYFISGLFMIVINIL